MDVSSIIHREWAAEENGEKMLAEKLWIAGDQAVSGWGVEGVGCGVCIYEGMNIKQFDSTYANGNGNERKSITYIYEKGYVKWYRKEAIKKDYLLYWNSWILNDCILNSFYIHSLEHSAPFIPFTPFLYTNDEFKYFKNLRWCCWQLTY